MKLLGFLPFLVSFSGAISIQRPLLVDQSIETPFTAEETPVVEGLDWKSDSLFLKHSTISTESATGKPTQWNVFSHTAFPKYKLRLKENKEKLCDPNVKQYVGYLDVDDDKHFFVWFFESRSNPKADPVILWLNGGPGCSSMTGLLMELGPCRVNPGGNGTTPNAYSWNNNANVLFLDQPVNVGFSYTDGEGVKDSDSAAQHVYGFLQIFYETFPKYSKLDFHVTGESYAGHYIPAIGKAISDGNAALRLLKEVSTAENKADNGLTVVNLKSLAIGNGLTDPLTQYEFYPDMAEDTKYGPILDEATVSQMRSKFGTCRSLIDVCYKYQSPFTCVPGSMYCNSAMIQPFQSTGLNIYDIRMKCDPQVNPLCYDIINDIETYLNFPEVQESLGVDRAFEGCKRDINMNFLLNGDWMKPFVNYIPPLLEEGIQVLIYAGDADYICNWIGNKAWTIALEWFGQEEFMDAEDHLWVSSLTGREAGELRMYENFAFLKVYEAGHMVPYDQPEHSVEFINEWISGGGKFKNLIKKE